jgi:hypothetical protein
MGSATGEALCPRGLFEEADYRKLRWHTDVIIAVIANPVLRDALESFSELLLPVTRCQYPFTMTLPVCGSWYADLDRLTRHPLTMWTQFSPDALVEWAHPPGPPLAVGAIAYIQRTLDLSLKQTLKAAHIKPRTYHSWREHPARHPRVTSQGQLWLLHQLTEDLHEAMGEIGVQRWLAEDNSRLTALLRGRFDDVAAMAYSRPGGGQDQVQNFDGALDERESKPRMPRYPITGLKMNPGDVAGPDR